MYVHCVTGSVSEIQEDFHSYKPTRGICGQRVETLHGYTGVEVNGTREVLFQLLCFNPRQFMSHEHLLIRGGEYKGEEIPRCPECLAHPDLPLFVLGDV